MSIIQPRLQYTNRSFEEIRQQLISIVQSTPVLNEKWTDYNESDIGLVLLELWCSIGDELNFYLDNQANEAFINTARQRASIVNLAKLIAYKLDPVTSAEAMITFSLPTDNTLDYPVIIPKYTRLTTSGSDNVQFVTIEAATIPAHEKAVDVRARQGILFEEEFESSGDSDMEFVLDRTDISANPGAIEVFVGLGDDITLYEQWTEAPNFIIALPTDNQKRFVVDTDSKDRTTINFGDGVFGTIPPDGYSIVVRYLASRGSAGNCGINTISTVVDTLYALNSQGQFLATTIAATNMEPAVGGSDRETIEHARRQAPQEFATLGRAVTKSDAKALIDGLPGILVANVWGEQELPHPDIRHFNQMYVTFLSDGISPNLPMGRDSWVPTTGMKDYILDFIEDKKIITTKVNFVEPNCIFVDLMIDAFISTTAPTATVLQNIMNTVNDFFTLDSTVFGKDLRYSNLMNALDDIDGIEYVKLKLRRNGISYTPPYGLSGTTVTFSGDNLGTTSKVEFTNITGGLIETTFTVLNEKTVTAVVPNEATTGPVFFTTPDAVLSTVNSFVVSDTGAALASFLGDDPVAALEQFSFGDHDIIARRHEFIQFSGEYFQESGDIGINITYARDEDPMRAQITYSPLYARVGQIVTFNGTESVSPNGKINYYQWSMGSRGLLYTIDAHGNYVVAPTQPADKQNFSTSNPVIYWKYTERPDSSVALVSLMTRDVMGNTALTAVPFEIKP